MPQSDKVKITFKVETRIAAEVRAADLPDHLWPCGCLINDEGAHRGPCPEYETVEQGRDGEGRMVRWWRPREQED